jgi:hypothetical protein
MHDGAKAVPAGGSGHDRLNGSRVRSSTSALALQVRRRAGNAGSTVLMAFRSTTRSSFVSRPLLHAPHGERVPDRRQIRVDEADPRLSGPAAAGRLLMTLSAIIRVPGAEASRRVQRIDRRVPWMLIVAGLFVPRP